MAQSDPTPVSGARRQLNYVGRILGMLWLCVLPFQTNAAASTNTPGVAVLLVDTDRVMGKVEEAIYGQFLEHINHSEEDGLYAEQIRGRGFEGRDFETYWQSFGERGNAVIADVK